MRYGMPPQEAFSTQWLVRDLRGKTEKNFWAYVSLFMRHMCEPEVNNQETYRDGVPKEGVNRPMVLARIGIMSLVRKKVQEFEHINGTNSTSVVNGNNDNGAEMNGNSLKDPAASATSHENGKNSDSDVKKEHLDNEDSTQNTTNDKDNKENVQKNDVGDKKRRKRFMFNIADGGYTELHPIWNNEEKASKVGKNLNVWNRRHDYWLLAGVLKHGYMRWQDIVNDEAFALLNEVSAPVVRVLFNNLPI